MDKTQQIFHTAKIIKNEIKACKGIPIWPLNINDINLQSAKSIVPQRLYLFLRWIIAGDSDVYEEPDPSIPCRNMAGERHVLSIAQDVIHGASNARMKVPKHVSLAMTMHHLMTSKLLITWLNRMGHCSSYDEIQSVGTSHAMEVAAKSEEYGAIIPSNISPMSFIQLAADNNDFNEETLDGKNTTHATTMVTYQRKPFGPEPPPNVAADHSQRRRSNKAQGHVYESQEFSAHGRRPAVTSFVGVNMDERFKETSEIYTLAKNIDFVWKLLRVNQSEVNPHAPDDIHTIPVVPSWSAFNSMLFPNIPQPTTIGYYPMIDRSSTDFSTVYTVTRQAQKISSSIGQSDSVITFDLAIYTKAKQVQWRCPEEFSDTVIRMGGFHIALTFLSLIGKKYTNSGLDDLLIESGVYAAGTTSALIKGKCYNRGIRGHKLAMEAFQQWISDQHPESEHIMRATPWQDLRVQGCSAERECWPRKCRRACP